MKPNVLYRITAGSLLALSLAACGSDSNEDDAPVDEQPLHGIWERSGYGDVYQVDASGAQAYQYNRYGCLLAAEFDADEAADLFAEPEFSADQRTLQVRQRDQPAFPAIFDKLDALPASCADGQRSSSAAASEVFEFFWHSFNDHYAFFAEREVDWPALYTAAAPLVSDDMGDEALAELLGELITAFDDGHVTLETDHGEYDSAAPGGVLAELLAGFAAQDEVDDFDAYAEDHIDAWNGIIFDLLDEDSISIVAGFNGVPMFWGTGADGAIAYLRIDGMEGYGDDPEADVTEQLAALAPVLDQMQADLRDSQVMIVDVRLNGGGDDAIALAIASRFSDQPNAVLRKSARSYLGERPEVGASLAPTAEAWLKPVAVIASGDTASAAETFLLAMKQLPQVTLIGQPSNGALSDTLPKRLPNGWVVTLSNEIYRDAAGQGYEVSGVAPAVSVPTFNLAAIEAGEDPAIAAALVALGLAD